MFRLQWVSERTRRSWAPTDSLRPAVFATVIFLAALVNLIVTVAINATIANERGNDYSSNFGWALMMPATSLVMAWSILDVLLCACFVINPVYCIVSWVIQFVALLVTAILTIIFYEWSAGAWVPGLFMLIAAIIDVAGFSVAASTLRQQKRLAKQGSKATNDV